MENDFIKIDDFFVLLKLIAPSEIIWNSFKHYDNTLEIAESKFFLNLSKALYTKYFQKKEKRKTTKRIINFENVFLNKLVY